MNKICIFLGVIGFGWLGWRIGAYLNLGLMGAYLISAVGSLGGVYAGWFINKKYLS